MGTETRTQVEIALEPLIAQADRDGMLLVTGYQNLAFTPDELRRANAEGKFRWGPDNWRLVSRADWLKGYEDAITRATAERDAARRRFGP